MNSDDRLREWASAARREPIDAPDVPVARMQQHPRRLPPRYLAPLAAAAAAAAVVGLVVAVRPHTHRVATPADRRSAQPSHGATPSRNPCEKPSQAALSVFGPDGSLRWRQDLPAGGFDQSPLLVDGPVLYAGTSGTVTAYRAADGTKIWQRRLGATVYHLWLADGELVVNVDQVSANARVVALDPVSGAPRWSYRVPAGGFLGDAVLTSDGGLAFTVRALKTVQVIDLSTGRLRWSVSGGHPNPNTAPSAGIGVVLMFGTDHTLTARDSRTGELRWRVANVDATGEVVVSGDTGVIVPGSIAGPTTVVAHSLTDGAELWRYTFRYFPDVFPDRSGFLLADGQTQVWTLVDAHTGHAAWSAHLRRTGTLRRSPTLTAAGAVFVIEEQTSVAFVDHATGQVRRVVVESGEGTAAARSDSYVLAGTKIRRVSPEHVVWTRDLPQYPSQPPATLTDGGVAALTRDPICLENLDPPVTKPSRR